MNNYSGNGKFFKRILIANRGEVAYRIIRACKNLNVETVAVYSEADKHSPHLDYADNKICIGPAQAALSYLNIDCVLKAAIDTDCQAIHPGFGFLAENPLFAAMCEQYKLMFIGPSAASIRTMGNKSQAKKTMKAAGLTVIPGNEGDIDNLDEALRIAEKTAYPVLLKATSGGGGKGIRPCYNKKDLKNSFYEAKMEAEKAFGDGSLYMEKLITNGRHIEFQILADSYNNVIHLGERECSIQRKNQKLIEESPSPAISSEMRDNIGHQIIESVKKLGYINAGTIEFLMDEENRLYFMEMNTRLQVEHPVSEMVTGFDIVEEQIRIAANNKLTADQGMINFNGCAIECRINAEDPDQNFIPSPGKIIRFNPSINEGPGKIRIDTHVKTGYEIPAFYDSMICKIISYGSNRPEAIKTMINSLRKFDIEGIKTTIPLHLKILNSKEFRSGDFNTSTLTKIMEEY